MHDMMQDTYPEQSSKSTPPADASAAERDTAWKLIHDCARHFGLDEESACRCGDLRSIDVNGMTISMTRGRAFADLGIASAHAPEWLLSISALDLGSADFLRGSAYCRALLQLNVSAMHSCGASLCAGPDHIAWVLRPLTGSERPPEVAALMRSLAAVALSASTLPEALREAWTTLASGAAAH
jgi:hypothetical protein